MTWLELLEICWWLDLILNNNNNNLLVALVLEAWRLRLEAWLHLLPTFMTIYMVNLRALSFSLSQMPPGHPGWLPPMPVIENDSHTSAALFNCFRLTFLIDVVWHRWNVAALFPAVYICRNTSAMIDIILSFQWCSLICVTQRRANIYILRISWDYIVKL